MKHSTSMNIASSRPVFPHPRRALLGGLCLLAGVVLPGSARAESLLAYHQDGTIYTASALDGKNPKKICRGDDPCISDDGRFLTFTRNGALPAKDKRTGQQGAAPRSIIVRELATGKETTLPANGATQVYGAMWSADDTWIAFNHLDKKSWQVAVVHPDGTALHTLTGKLDTKGEGYYLAGWNQHDGGVLVQNLETMAQIDPAKGEVSWQRPVKELTGEDGASSDMRCTISADGKLLVATRYVEDDEFDNLDGPSSYLVLKDFPDGKPRRATPEKFDVATPWLESGGETVLLRGFTQRDITPVRNSDGVRLKTRIYRYNIPSGKLTPLMKQGEYPSASRG